MKLKNYMLPFFFQEHIIKLQLAANAICVRKSALTKKVVQRILYCVA